jgi:hypothetical protein
MNKIRTLWAALLLATSAAAPGCADSGPPTYAVSGTVTFDGQPLPYGEVIFTPDAAQKNSGPQGIARIQDGKFDTRAAGGKGIAGGPTVIRVNGLTGPGGKTLCEYELKADLPRADSTYDIAVPKKGAANAGPGKDI